MHNNYISKFLSTTLLGLALILWSCDQKQAQLSVSSPVPSPSQSIPPEVERKPKSLSISERIYEQAGTDYPLLKISEVPVLSIQFSNYFAKQDRKIKICSGETKESFVFQHFPKFYQLGSQEYLVELLCEISTYNNRFGYLLYRPEAGLTETEMKKFPQNAYHRTEKGYYFFKKNGVNQPELTVPAGELIPLVFDRYWLDESGKRIHTVGDAVSGKRLYNPKQRILWVLTKGRGMGDCGTFSRYRLEKERFKLLEYRYQACCSTEQECNAPGYRLPPHKYPQVYP